MITLFNPYHSGPIEPIVMVGENIGIFTQGDYLFARVVHIEPLPPSRQLTQDLGAINTGASSGVTELTVARAQDGNLLHVRMMPLDPIEVQVYQQRATSRHTVFSAASRVNLSSGKLDPYWASSTYFVLGNQKSLYGDISNVSGYNLTLTRVRFWGFRYKLDPLPAAVQSVMRKLASGRALTPQEGGLVVRATLVPAEGQE